MLTQDDALHWLDRWDRQQEFYIADREERFSVIADVVATVVDRPDPLIVDLGCGPGSLSVRLLERLLDRHPAARVIGIDADPLLLGLARSAYGDRAGLRFVDHDLRDAGWPAALGLEGPADAVVSTTALHWLHHDQLAAVYAACGRLLRPGGVLVNGDNLDETAAGLVALTTGIRERRAERVAQGAGGPRLEDWASWWEAIGDAPELADLLAGRPAQPIDHNVPDEPTLAEHVALLRAAGFDEVGTVWQWGDDRVLVGLRGQ